MTFTKTMIKTGRYIRHRSAITTLLLASALLWGCKKQGAGELRGEYMTVSNNGDKNENLSSLQLPIEGGKDTLYVHSNVDFQAFFQTSDNADWVTIESSSYDSQKGATRLILNISPLTGTFTMRSGTLSVSNKQQYIGSFVTLSQGYTARFTENFSWLKYGSVNPFDETREILLSNWTAVQAAYGWTSTVAPGATAAYCYGRNDHVKIGTQSTGGDLITPVIRGIDKDSIMLLSFNAVAYVSQAGQKDGNKLTISITEGGVFDSGKTTQTVDLGYYDYQSPSVDTKMWDNSSYKFYIKKPNLNPLAQNIRIRLLTGDTLTAAGNRIFVDNVNLYTIHQQGEK